MEFTDYQRHFLNLDHAQPAKISRGGELESLDSSYRLAFAFGLDVSPRVLMPIKGGKTCL